MPFSRRPCQSSFSHCLLLHTDIAVDVDTEILILKGIAPPTPPPQCPQISQTLDTEYLAIKQQSNKQVALPPSAPQYAVHAVIVVVPVVDVVVVVVIVVVVVVVVVVTEHLTIKAW